MNQLEPNTLLQNRYLVGQMIGNGGMGEVYLAVDQRIGGPVVIKRTYFAGDDVLGGGFENEARALGRLRHSTLPKVTDHFVEHGDQFIVMDYVAGEDLSKRLAATSKPFPLSWVMFWADQLLDALVYMHSNEPPIVHRDIKPQNLKLTESNNVVLLDFGLSRKGVAKLEAAPAGGFAKPFAPLEQIRGNETYPRSDVYSLAATLYFLLTNVVPPDAASRADAVLSGSPDPLRPASQINAEVPRTIADVILKAMAVSHDQRFSDARSMQKALREAFAKMQQDPEPEPEPEKTVIMEMPPVAEKPAADIGAATIPYGMVSEPPSPTVPDLDATVRYDGPIQPVPTTEEPKQADIRTEVFITPDITFDEPVKPTADVQSDTSAVTETFGADKTMPVMNVESTPSPIPDSTVPNVNLDQPAAEVPQGAQTAAFENFSDTNDFSAPASPFADSGFGKTVPPADAEIRNVEAPVEEAAPIAVAAAAPSSAPAKKKTSKGLLIGILIGLFLLGILGAGGAGLAWYMYSGQGNPFGSTPTPSPTPEVTPSATPSATPTPDSNTNQNVTQPSATPTPEPTATADVTPERERTPITRPTLAPPTPRPTQVTPPTPRPTSKPTVKPTPKPSLRGREIPQ